MSTRNNIPYLDIINQFKSACSASVSIATFDTGTIDFLDANAVNKNYPYIYLRPISSTGVVDKVRGLTFELYSLDVPKLSDESPVKVLSSTEQRIYELISWFNFGPPELQQVYDITITDLSPVNEAFQDRVFGWVATVEVATPWQWNYCDYPRSDWPTATPPPSASPTPIPTSTATPTPTGPTPTPTTSPTATPTGTPGPTATATPFPTPPPSPTPSPTALPAFYAFQIDDINFSGSLEDTCDQSTPVDTTVYVKWFDEDQRFPDRLVGKTIYSDPTLQTVYTSSAIPDDSVYRLTFAENEYAAIDLRWNLGTGSNQVLTAQGCLYPTIETLPSTSSTIDGSTMRGVVTEYQGRDFEQYGFYYGSNSGSLNNFITASYPAGTGIWNADYPGDLLPNEVYYFQAAVTDEDTGFEFVGQIISGSTMKAYAHPYTTDDSFGSDSNLNTAISELQDNADVMCTGTGWGPAQDENWVALSFPFVSGSHVTVDNFFNAKLFNDEALTTVGLGHFTNQNPNLYTQYQGYSKYADYSNIAALTGGMDHAILIKKGVEYTNPDGSTYTWPTIVTGSNCIQP